MSALEASRFNAIRSVWQATSGSLKKSARGRRARTTCSAHLPQSARSSSLNWRQYSHFDNNRDTVLVRDIDHLLETGSVAESFVNAEIANRKVAPVNRCLAIESIRHLEQGKCVGTEEQKS